MAYNANKRFRAKNNVRRSSGFTKVDADLTRVTVETAGSLTLPSQLRGRCFVEWHPRADCAGPDKRCFYGKVGATLQNDILGEGGNKLPRAGKSLDPSGRTFLVFFPGVFKVWEEDGRTTATSAGRAQEDLDSSVNSDALRNAALLILASGAAQAPSVQRQPEVRRGFVEAESVRSTPSKTPGKERK